ncbi:MAG TPA: PDDEXK nuclease domain-containing protein [Puia sp.]
METTPIKISGIHDLVHAIQHANRFFLDQAQRQVNTSLTLRNWIIGYYIVEYEQNGRDRAEYGERLFAKVGERLKGIGLGSIRGRHLYLCKDLYLKYPEILRSVTAKLYLVGFQDDRILRTVSAKLVSSKKKVIADHLRKEADLLLDKLSFSHFIELLRVDTALKRSFYETQATNNNWSVRELKRAIDSMLFERTGLSKDKQAVLEGHRKGSGLKPEDVFRDPYLLDFLGLKEKSEYVENDLEQAIIDHLQKFLLEMGRGFCFEARQKRITFDNTHYRIDLVFYHRLLRCHVLLDLKMGKFTPGDAGQMHMYLNYFRENETCEGDHPPIGIILCTDKSETLVKYATSGLAQPVFVSNYITSLPSEKELQKIISEEREKLQK